MIEARSVVLLASKELAEAWRNRWFLLFAVSFAVLALGMSWLTMAGVSSGFASLSRTAASLLNLAVLIVPLMGLTLGAGAIAPERERGSLLYLLAQPVSATEVVLGKFFGLAAAVAAALFFGFGLAGVALARTGVGQGAGAAQAAGYLAFLGLALLLAMATVSLGLLVSALGRKGSVALGTAIFLWFALVFLGDLGVLGTSIALKLTPGQLLTGVLINPLEVYKVAAQGALAGGLEALGPAGLYAARVLGGNLIPLLVVLLVAWTVVPLVATSAVLSRRGGLP